MMHGIPNFWNHTLFQPILHVFAKQNAQQGPWPPVSGILDTCTYINTRINDRRNLGHFWSPGGVQVGVQSGKRRVLTPKSPNLAKSTKSRSGLAGSNCESKSRPAPAKKESKPQRTKESRPRTNTTHIVGVELGVEVVVVSVVEIDVPSVGNIGRRSGR